MFRRSLAVTKVSGIGFLIMLSIMTKSPLGLPRAEMERALSASSCLISEALADLSLSALVDILLCVPCCIVTTEQALRGAMQLNYLLTIMLCEIDNCFRPLGNYP